MSEVNNYRKKKISYLLVLLIASQIMIYIITPLLINYLFEVQGFHTEMFAQCLSFILPVLVILIISARKNEYGKSVLLFKIDEFYKQPIRASSLFLSIFIGFLLNVAVLYMISFFEIVYILVTGEYWIIGIIPSIDIKTFLYSIIIFAILPSFFEELLYRGMYYDTFRSTKKFLIYIIPTAMFVFAHAGIFSAFSALVLNLVLIHLMIRGVSIYVCTTVHFVYNLTTLFFENIINLPLSPIILLTNYASNNQMFATLFFYLGISILSVTFVVKLLYYLTTHSVNTVTEQSTNDIKKLSTIEKISVGMMLVVSLFSFVIRIMN